MMSRMTAPARAVRAVPLRPLIWLFHLGLPLAGLWLLLTNPMLDVAWEDHTAHFWLILAVATVSLGLAVAIARVTERRSDARLFLVALAFAAAAGFFALHALATPAVVLATPNAAFSLSTPVGILLAGLIALPSALHLRPTVAAAILDRRRLLAALVAAALLGWGIASLAPGSRLGQPLPPADAQPILRLIAAVGIVLTVATAAGYLALFRRRPSVVSASIVTAFVLLAEALVAVAESRSWHASWWEWHLLLLAAFGYVAYSVHAEDRREGGSATSLFRALSLEETVRRLRDEYDAVLERLVAELEAAAASDAPVDPDRVAADLATRFGLSGGQADVLAQAARALAAERREVRRLGLFRHYLSPEVATALLDDPTQAALGGATVELSVLFADLQGFTSFTERSDPADVVTLLNTYFGAVVPIVLGEGGTVVQFIGDAIVAVFNAPVPQPDHPLRAARAALEFQAATGRIAASHPDWPRFRVGIATGPAVVGNVGSDEVRSFTAIGDTVNLAARLQAEAAPGAILVSEATAEALRGRAVLATVGPFHLKGKAEPAGAFELTGLVPGRDGDAERAPVG